MAANLSAVCTGKQRKVEDGSQIVFGEKFPGGKASVKRRVVAMQEPVLLLPKFGTKSSHIFLLSP
jgi:hypothetical protein